MKLIPVDPENLSLAWKDVERYIAQSLAYTDENYAISDVISMIKERILILWVVYNEDKAKACGCVLTEIYLYPKSKSLNIFCLGGDELEQMLTILDDLKEYAISMSCKKIECYGRPGWEKVLKSLNFEKTHTVMRLKI